MRKNKDVTITLSRVSGPMIVDKPNQITRLAGAAKISARCAGAIKEWRVGDYLSDVEADQLCTEYENVVTVKGGNH